MEGFRELALLLKNYSADEQILVLDKYNIQQFPAWSTVVNATTEIERPPILNTKSEQLNTKAGSLTPLWNTLLFLDLSQEELSDSNRVAYLCWQRLAALKTLMAVGAIKSLREIAEPLLQTANDFQLFNVAIETATQLRQLCALHDGNMNGFEQYCTLIAEYEQIQKAEQAADDEYDAFLFLQMDSESTPISMALEAKNACQRLEIHAVTCTSNAFVFNYYFLQSQAAFLEAQWDNVVRISIQADHLLSGNTAVDSTKVSGFRLNQALGLANLGELSKAIDVLGEAIATETSGSHNWYRLQELKLTWLLHIGLYSAALDLCKVLNGKHKNGAWASEQKRLFNTVFLFLAEQQLFTISNRVKGMLLMHWIPSQNLQIPELGTENLDLEATILLLQLPKWIKKGQTGVLAERLHQYLIQSGACAPQSIRFHVLIDALQQIDQGQMVEQAINTCLLQLEKFPLDYSTPEAAPEILMINTILALVPF